LGPVVSARESGPGSPWARLQRHVLRAVEKQKKAPALPAAAAAAAGAPAAAKAAAVSNSQRTSASSSGAASSSKSSSNKQKAAPAETPTPPVAAAAASQPGLGVRQCWACGKLPGEGQIVQKCSGCRKALYCSRGCQETAWKGHKADCKKWAAERAAAKTVK
jgi:hypothetical protein